MLTIAVIALVTVYFLWHLAISKYIKELEAVK
jgi:hypothetical protein